MPGRALYDPRPANPAYRPGSQLALWRGVTLRQVMYRLVSEGVLPHTPLMYRHLSSHLTQARAARATSRT
ncbi:hypothetical protein GCM10010207_86790 [Streptomyces atratus]|nr:hypothetical protein GCM10010207_86790 [Streptomyces atratus]